MSQDDRMCRMYALGLCSGLKCSDRCKPNTVRNPLPRMNTHTLSGELDKSVRN